MPQVDPDDDSLLRYVLHHYRFDPARNERRNVVVAAYDNEAEFMEGMEAASRELRARKEHGEAEPVERLSGVVLEPGHDRRVRRERIEGRRFGGFRDTRG
jgi:hypothetical protein